MLEGCHSVTWTEGAKKLSWFELELVAICSYRALSFCLHSKIMGKDVFLLKSQTVPFFTLAEQNKQNDLK